ncbi:hypothetical protein JZU68_04255, partial [bacterium]|nr:hypothetical protein [bacterium]
MNQKVITLHDYSKLMTSITTPIVPNHLHLTHAPFQSPITNYQNPRRLPCPQLRRTLSADCAHR